jgi:hypothetical protein
VDLILRSGGAFPADGMLLDLSILGPDDRQIAAATTRVQGPQTAGRVLAVHFDFAAPAPVVVGGRYRIAWETVLPSELSWLGADGDPYPRGDAFGCNEELVPGRDYNFITYGPEVTPTPLPPTATLSPTVTPTPPIGPTATPAISGGVCPQIRHRVPQVELDAALANPFRIEGYLRLERPGLPPGPFNRPRTWLTIRRLGAPYDRFWNGLVWRAGCP